jgi:MFS family permease
MEQIRKPNENNGFRLAKTALAFAMLLASLGTSIANIALPALAQSFSAPFADVQAVVVAYLSALTVSVVFAGRIGDRYGMKKILLVGLGLFSVASLLCAFAPGLWFLVGARFLQGVGAAILMTLSMALMRELAGESQIGRAMGLLGTVSALGTALGPSLGGIIIPIAGWRWIFLVQTPFALFALTLVAVALPRDAASGKAADASLWSAVNRSLVINLLINVMVAAVMMTTLVVGPFYLGLGLGLAATSVGMIMSVGPVISIASGVPLGKLVDVWGSGPALIAGLSMLSVGTVLLALLPGSLGIVGYLIAIAVLTPGYQLFQAANNTAALADVAKDRRGMASGLLSLSRNVGLIAGALLMGSVFAHAVGTHDIVHAGANEIASGMRITFSWAGGMMVFATLIAYSATRRSQISNRRDVFSDAAGSRVELPLKKGDEPQAESLAITSSETSKFV